ncbi:hypothetical protein AX774_g3238, partial [Zancudomyces culisetae]
MTSSYVAPDEVARVDPSAIAFGTLAFG